MMVTNYSTDPIETALAIQFIVIIAAGIAGIIGLLIIAAVEDRRVRKLMEMWRNPTSGKRHGTINKARKEETK